MNLVNLFRKWSFLFILLIPIVVYFLVLHYFTPLPVVIKFTVDCSGDSCYKNESENNLYYSDQFKLQIDNVNRVDNLSKPFSGFMRFYPKIINNSTFIISVSNPKQDILQYATVICNSKLLENSLFSYGSEIPLAGKTDLLSVSDVLDGVTNSLKECVNRIQTPSDLKITVYPDSVVSMRDAKIDFLVEFFPDKTSKSFLALEMLVLFGAFITLSKEILSFLKSGWNYFRK